VTSSGKKAKADKKATSGAEKGKTKRKASDDGESDDTEGQTPVKKAKVECKAENGDDDDDVFV